MRRNDYSGRARNERVQICKDLFQFTIATSAAAAAGSQITITTGHLKPSAMNAMALAIMTLILAANADAASKSSTNMIAA